MKTDTNKRYILRDMRYAHPRGNKYPHRGGWLARHRNGVPYYADHRSRAHRYPGGPALDLVYLKHPFFVAYPTDGSPPVRGGTE